jgi:hypothetical protein
MIFPFKVNSSPQFLILPALYKRFAAAHHLTDRGIVAIIINEALYLLITMDTILKLPQPTGNIGVDSDISRVG